MQEDTLLDSTGITSAWWDNFVNEVVGPEEWRENFRMTRKNLLKLKLPNFESKQPPKRSSVNAEHLFRFHVWTQNICSVFALKVAFSNLSGIVWTRPKTAMYIIINTKRRTCHPQSVFHALIQSYQSVFIVRVHCSKFQGLFMLTLERPKGLGLGLGLGT